MRRSASYILVFIGLLAVLVGGLVAATLLESWLIVAMLIPAVAAWGARVAVMLKHQRPPRA